MKNTFDDFDLSITPEETYGEKLFKELLEVIKRDFEKKKKSLIF